MTSVLRKLPSACGLGQHFQDLCHSFSLYGPPSWQITYIYYLLFSYYMVTISHSRDIKLATMTMRFLSLSLSWLPKLSWFCWLIFYNKMVFKAFTQNTMLRISRVIHFGRFRNKLQGLNRLHVIKQCSNLLSTEQKK